MATLAEASMYVRLPNNASLTFVNSIRCELMPRAEKENKEKKAPLENWKIRAQQHVQQTHDDGVSRATARASGREREREREKEKQEDSSQLFNNNESVIRRWTRAGVYLSTADR